MKGLRLIGSFQRYLSPSTNQYWLRYHSTSSINIIDNENRIPAPAFRTPEEEKEEILTKFQHLRLDWNFILHDISNDPILAKKITTELIDTNSWKKYVNLYRRSVFKEPFTVFTENELKKLTSLLPKASKEYDQRVRKKVHVEECVQFVFENLFQHALKDLKPVINANRILSTTSDLRLPHEWYPYTRLMKRKIIFHGGPTNSGKTYQAMQRLKAADKEKGGGVYCSPLRLLAAEIYERLNKEGIYTDLSTGQEQRYVPDATHISCTVERVQLNKDYDIAVIDEIQMIADRDRGASWTRALLGLRANEVHVCGGIEAADIVQSLCETTGDDFELITYERFSELEVEQESLKGDYSKVQAGDCIVAFSKADLFAIKKEIESLTPYKCALIYGQLPPETRSTQARLFNDMNSGYDVLVASDAIGMGLNLNIRRVIFHTVLKTVGNHINTLFISPSHIKQIAGRAGRKSSVYNIGKVTAWQERDLAYVKAVMKYQVPKITAAGLFPEPETIEKFYERFQELNATTVESHENIMKVGNNHHQTKDETITTSSSDKVPSLVPSVMTEKKPITSFTPGKRVNKIKPAVIDETIQFGTVIERFVELSQVDSRYFISGYEGIITLSNWLHTIPLSAHDRFIFASAPLHFNNDKVMNQIYYYAACYAFNHPVFLNVRLSRMKPTTLEEFSELCEKNQMIELYLWLSLRFPNHFIDSDHAMLLMNAAIELIAAVLAERKLKDASYSMYGGYEITALKLRKARNAKDQITLPPIEYSENIRNDYLQNYLAIPREELYMKSGLRLSEHNDHDDDDDESEDDGKENDGKYSSFKGKKVHEKHRNHRHSDVSFSKSSKQRMEKKGRGGFGGGRMASEAVKAFGWQKGDQSLSSSFSPTKRVHGKKDKPIFIADDRPFNESEREVPTGTAEK